MRKRATDGTKISTSPTITKKTVRIRRRAERLFSGTAYPAIMRLPAGPPRQSRRALWALLSMRCNIDGIKTIPHPEEAAQRLSRRAHRASPATCQLLHRPSAEAREKAHEPAGARREQGRCIIA